MKLHEYQSKEIFARYGVPVPPGPITASPTEVREIAARLGRPVVIKAQVLVGGRGKAGGIRRAATPAEAETVAAAILSMEIKGQPVRQVLVTEAADIVQEFYLGMTIDRVARQPVLMASAAGGVDIETVARATPERIARVRVDPFLGLRDYQTRDLALAMGLDARLVPSFSAIARGLERAFVETDAALAEINPLAILSDGTLAALDAKIVLDDNALTRHPDLATLREPAEETAAECAARENGLSYVQIGGTIGCMVNGAGLAMATMDLIRLHGAEPANFLDIGGGAKADRVAAGLRIILTDPNARAVLFNIFGGITRCDEVARGILAAREGLPRQVPMVARLVGTNEVEGRQILASANITPAASLMEATEKTVAAARGATA
jgi:succinyl-CoA synthetase beta subunit